MDRYDLDLKMMLQFRQHTVEFILDPNQWGSLSLPITLNWNTIPFGEPHLLAIPDDESGVYSFIIKPGIANHSECAHLMYIGKAKSQSFRDRYRQYLQDQRTQMGRPLIVHMLKTWPEHLCFCYATIKQTSYIDDIEDCLIRAFIPPINTSYPADIRRSMTLWRL